ncbi:MAG: beta strand repeat-containing protein [Pyrinomonadaceae bacterium]
MNRIIKQLTNKVMLHLVVAAAIMLSMSFQGLAQTAAGTVIKNVASATYSDSSSNNYSATSNEVTTTVAKVSGLVITPDGTAGANVAPGQTGVKLTYTVKNTGNFTDDVVFPASGAGWVLPTGFTATAAVIKDAGGDIDVFGNSSAVNYSLAAGGTVQVELTYSVATSATVASTVSIALGDTPGTTTAANDNQTADNSGNEIHTVSTGAVNGSREAKGFYSVTVEDDAQIKVNLTAPAGPITLGQNISYSTEVCNTGARALDPYILNGTSTSAVWVIVPIPTGTEITSTVPTGTFYTTDPLSTAPNSATWSSTAPGTLSTVTRIAYPASTTAISAGSCVSTGQTYEVKVTTTDASQPIVAIVDAFGKNSIGATITDQSGDNVSSKGDGNGNFTEPTTGGTVSPSEGFMVPTSLAKTGGVLIGPSSSPDAVGPTNNNDDYTNLSVDAGINVASGGVTTAGDSVVFTNTVKNTGNANDTYTLTAPTVPSGWTVEISTNGGATYTVVKSDSVTSSVNLAINYNSSADIKVRVTAPAGQNVLTGYDNVIQATSQIDNTKSNQTIDRVYTGFVKLTKTATVTNGTGVGAATDAVPGAEVKYEIKYENIATTGGTGNATLTVNNLVITEDGTAGSNNWGTYTSQKVGSASDTNSGTITGDSAGSTSLTDTISTVAAGSSGTFSFVRVIN